MLSLEIDQELRNAMNGLVIYVPKHVREQFYTVLDKKISQLMEQEYKKGYQAGKLEANEELDSF